VGQPADDAPVPSRIEQRRRSANVARSATYTKRRQQIIDGAVEVIQRKGFDFTLHDVAEAVNVDRASVYYYFADKEQLVVEAVGGAGDDLVREARRIMKLDRGAPEKLRLLFETLLSTFESNLPDSTLYAAEARRGKASWAQRGVKQQRILDRCALAIVKQGQADGTFRANLQPMQTVRLMMGAIEAAYGMLGRSGSQELAEALACLVIAGLAQGSVSDRI
jgi:AcrR family transcriptional regulator